MLCNGLFILMNIKICKNCTLYKCNFSCIFKYNKSIFNEMLLLSSMFCTILPPVFQDHGMESPYKIPQCSCYARCWSRVLVESVSCSHQDVLMCFYYAQGLGMKFKLQTESWLKTKH